MHLLEFGQHLIHLLLAVAGSLTDDEVGIESKWTGLAQDVAIAGFDQRTEISGKLGLCQRNSRIIIETAQDDVVESGGTDYLSGSVLAE